MIYFNYFSSFLFLVTLGLITNVEAAYKKDDPLLIKKHQLACLKRLQKNRVEIYTTPTCPYCKRAKKLLKDNCVTFHEIDVSGDPQKRRVMAQRAKGGKTVPQIFINNTLIGGSTALEALEQSGELREKYGLRCCTS